MEIEDDNSDKMNEDEMKDIIKYINQLDYDKYEKDLEIREALQLLKNKMDKEKEVSEPITFLQTTENVITPEINSLSIKDNIIEPIKPEEKLEIKQLTEEEKINLESNWNNSTNINHTYDHPETTKENIETKKKIEKIYNNEKKKLAIHSYQSFQKLLARQGFNQYPNISKDRLQISVQHDRNPIVKNTHASIPFLLSQPYI